ncbi:hypothetical protein SGCOL_007799 [Colletotrichum sp. CLE4]
MSSSGALGDNEPAASQPVNLDSLSMAFPSADQACKECRRRKAKCNRAIPTCNLCVKYRRHCLYEKHARTPLTRKHLTEVEERDLNLLEAHPTDDFEWDEQETLTNYSASPEAILEADLNGEVIADPIADGMASLAVSERESGYLGVASGAALLRLLEPSTPRRRTQSSSSRPGGGGTMAHHHQHIISPPIITQQPDPNRHITDAMIDAYFRLYHVSYPIIHEATFRAQYAGVIPRPSGDCWLVLAYTVAAIGVYTTAANLDNLDTSLFAQARSILSFNFLEVGNLTLVQALTLISNYQQKRDKPNSGYNYLGLAVRMAMGLGLHKEFQGWNISPLNMEIRRRVWWSLCVFDVGATITFSRPSVWPYEGVEVSLPLNVDDKSLTAISKSYPPETDGITPYTAVRTQASFHIATTPVYTRVISKPLPSPDEMLRLDHDLLEPWLASVSSYFSSTSRVPPKYALAHAVMNWRYRNLRIIMYRPFVIRRALQARDRRPDDSPDNVRAFEKCLAEAKATITSISDFWQRNEHNRLGAWYAL